MLCYNKGFKVTDTHLFCWNKGTWARGQSTWYFNSLFLMVMRKTQTVKRQKYTRVKNAHHKSPKQDMISCLFSLINRHKHNNI